MDENKLDEELKKIWDEKPNVHSNDIKEDSWEDFRSKAFPSKKKTFSWRNYAAAAAVIVMLIGTGIYLIKDPFKNDISIAGNVIENTTSEIKTITLPDSSKVELSPHSKIEFANNFSINRKIEMEGEAYFKVKKDKKHPFEVFCNETTTKVLGTSFTVVGQDKTGVIVMLYEGSVQMNVKGQSENWVLKPGEKFTYGNGNPAIEEFNRFTDFDNEKLSNVSTYIEKNYGYKMIIPAEYNDQRITLRITKKEDLKTIIQLISEMYNLKFEVNEKVKQITFQ
ncbi:FecR family protein [Flavobacterium sp. MC2016-06]|uniref:FecR family protein n=1 Tax=Flavobacterium sp. MC2016-06 TaxID=2676308 RepID=UPI0012BAED52|nr:FecR family protein [Flavobacterium sp. MC2016-06]MBU3860409.1 FecR family protein [Flavobacterium sp. MC2016-06]